MTLEQDVKKVFGIKKYPKRTKLQNKALHLYFALLAKAFNDAGYSMQQVLDVIHLDIPATPINVKEDIWKTIQYKMFKKKSTTELDTTEISELYKSLDLALKERLGIAVAFPSEEQTEAYLKSLIKQK